MEGQESRTLLLEALQALYHHPDPQIRTAANRWLDEFQHTMEAWQVSDSVLHDSSSSLEAFYFCAQTLRTKVQRDFEDLPPSAPLSLRSSLMTLLMKFCQGPATVRTQLCLAMAALAVQISAEEWGQGGVVHWLGCELGSQTEAIPVLLELLAVFPQVNWQLFVIPVSGLKTI
jgi:transportin-3